ncbi:hypothetical protein D3C71_1683260 [compost metagenome]
MQLAGLDDIIKLALELRDPAADMPAVGLQLALPGTSGTDTAAEPGQIFAVSRQAGQQIGELCQLNLYDAFSRLGPAGEYIQDQLGAVNNLQVECFLQISHLGSGQLLVKDRRIGA